MARRRGLTEGEKELWHRVARTAVPLHPKTDDSQPTPSESLSRPAPKTPAVAPPAAPAPRTQHLDKGNGGAGRFYPAPTPAEWLAAGPLRMDHKTHKRMQQGKLRPEARLDLHGMTLAVAQPELTRFLLSCHATGIRLALVITGKGKGTDGPLPTRPGALRHQVPHWLHMPPLSSVVQQVTAAHYRHGGEGAYYVYLRRQG